MEAKSARCAGSAQIPLARFTTRSRSATTATRQGWKAEQEKQRREQAIANATGLRVLAAISAAVPVRLMKRDLLFVASQLTAP
ncbi:MAG: hypothetical protein PW792_10465 [Acidobacteriaceae bacterium]|nr:hypothetical protein [Acidobacteriaceae bacterium]